MKVFPITDGSQHHQLSRNLPRIKSQYEPNLCDYPWRQININRHGYIYICACGGWLPFPIGHVLDFNTVEEIFNSEPAKEIQESINEGNYKYCDTEYCTLSGGGNLTHETYSKYDYCIHLGIDESCNLQCPSCRTKMIFHDGEDYLKEKHKWINQIRKWISEKPLSKFYIMIGGDGEPFASLVYRKLLLTEFDKDVHYDIRTNATLIKKHIHDLKLLPNLKNIEISLDAASSEVYNMVRPPGRWDVVVVNIAYLNELRKKYNFNIKASFVIQKKNLDDVLPFIDFCQTRNIKPLFSLLQDWSSFPNYDAECVHKKHNADYSKFIKIISTQKFLDIKPYWISNYNLQAREM